MAFPLNVYVILDMNIKKTTAVLRLPTFVLILMNVSKPQYMVSVTLVKPILNVLMVSTVHTLVTAMLVTNPMMPRLMTVLISMNVPLLLNLVINTTVMPKQPVQTLQQLHSLVLVILHSGKEMAKLVPILMNVTRVFPSTMIAMVPTNFAQTKITVLTVSVPQVTREQQLVMPTLNAFQSPSAQPLPVMTPTLLVSNLKE